MTSLTGSLIVHGQYSGLSEALGAQAGACSVWFDLERYSGDSQVDPR